MPDKNQELILHGVYNTLYNATTRPEFKFVVTRYFIDEWVPLLGPSLAWLVVGLRQQCFWNHRRDWCIVDKATLSQDTALNQRTIERCLKRPLSRWFVLEVTHRYRYRSHLGKKVRDKNRYQLLLDEPLSPRHQLGLARLLETHLPSSMDSLDAALAVLDILLDTPHLTDKISYTGEIPKNLQRRTILELVEAAAAVSLRRHAHDERVVTIDQRCARLYNQIVQPNKIYVGWQYFRQEWVPLLGHALAWLVIYLRRHCFWDETSGELRDTIHCFKKELAAAIGQTTRNLANLMDNPHISLFFSTQSPDDEAGSSRPAHKNSRNSPTTYRARLVDEPLTPADQHHLAEALRSQLEGELYGRDPENGQLNLFPIFDRLSSNRQNFAYGHLAEITPPSSRQECRSDNDAAEKMPQQDTFPDGKNAVTGSKDSQILPEKETIPKKEHPAVEKHKTGVNLILDDLAVQEPTRSRLLANPNLTVATIGAWFLYAETQPGLRNPHSYVIKRLLANDPPPEAFLAFAELTDDTWHLFEKSADRLRQGRRVPAQLSPDLLDTFISWTEIYAGLDPAVVRPALSLQAAPSLPRRGANLAGSSPDETEVAPEVESAGALWQATLNQLQLQMTKQTFNTWLKQTSVLSYRDDQFLIGTKTSHAKDWLENRLINVVERTLSEVVGKPTRVSFAVLEGND